MKIINCRVNITFYVETTVFVKNVKAIKIYAKDKLKLFRGEMSKSFIFSLSYAKP